MAHYIVISEVFDPRSKAKKLLCPGEELELDEKKAERLVKAGRLRVNATKKAVKPKGEVVKDEPASGVPKGGAKSKADQKVSPDGGSGNGGSPGCLGETGKGKDGKSEEDGKS